MRRYGWLALLIPVAAYADPVSFYNPTTCNVSCTGYSGVAPHTLGVALEAGGTAYVTFDNVRYQGLVQYIPSSIPDYDTVAPTILADPNSTHRITFSAVVYVHKVAVRMGRATKIVTRHDAQNGVVAP